MPVVPFTRRAMLGIMATCQVPLFAGRLERREFLVPIFRPAGLRWYPASCGTFRIGLGNDVWLDVSCIPAGRVEIGTEESIYLRDFVTAKPVRTVTVSEFGFVATKVTIAQWLRALQLPRERRELRNSYAGMQLTERDLRRPVSEGVSYDDADEFCRRISKYTGLGFRLPSEAEWEYACRAGTQTRYFFGDDYTEEVVATGRILEVGSKNAPNRFGLVDVHGGPWEWCEDWFHRDYAGAPADGRPWRGSSNGDESVRMLRSGPLSLPPTTRSGSAARDFHSARGWRSELGLRVAVDFAHGVGEPILQSVQGVTQNRLDAISPGQLVRLAGTQLWEPEWASPPAVYFGLESAALWSLDRGVLGVVVPKSVVPGDEVAITVSGLVQSSQPLLVAAASAVPELFADRGHVLALNHDGSKNSTANPALPGTAVSLFGTGFGDLSSADMPVSVVVGGRPSSVLFAGQAPDLISGVVQINVLVPKEIGAGQKQVVASVGTLSSAGERFVAVG